MSEEPPESPGSAFDLFRTLQKDVSRELLNVYRTLPASVEASYKGQEGAVEIPPEQALDATLKTVRVLATHVPNIAAAAHLALSVAERLQKRVDELERRVTALESE